MSQTPPLPPPLPAGAQAMPPSERRKTSGLAVAALVLGLLGIIPFLGSLLGLVAVVLGIVALATGVKGKGLAVTGIVAGLLLPVIVNVVVISAMLLPSLGHARELSRRSKCAENLKIIGVASQVYWSQYDYAGLTSLQQLVDARFISAGSGVFKCPSAKSDRSCDYFFATPANSVEHIQNATSVILACDLRGNHPDGREVLFLDSHVAWMSEARFQAALNQPQNTVFAAALREFEGDGPAEEPAARAEGP